MLKRLLLKYLTKDLDWFSKELVNEVVLGHKEFRPASQQGPTLTLDDLAAMDSEYAQYISNLSGETPEGR